MHTVPKLDYWMDDLKRLLSVLGVLSTYPDELNQLHNETIYKTFKINNIKFYYLSIGCKFTAAINFKIFSRSKTSMF